MWLNTKAVFAPWKHTQWEGSLFPYPPPISLSLPLSFSLFSLLLKWNLAIGAGRLTRSLKHSFGSGKSSPFMVVPGALPYKGELTARKRRRTKRWWRWWRWWWVGGSRGDDWRRRCIFRERASPGERRTELKHGVAQGMCVHVRVDVDVCVQEGWVVVGWQRLSKRRFSRPFIFPDNQMWHLLSAGVSMAQRCHRTLEHTGHRF